MLRLQSHINAAGFETRNIGYRSRHMTVREAVEHVSAELGDFQVDHPLIGVTHSMGALVLRGLVSRFN